MKAKRKSGVRTPKGSRVSLREIVKPKSESDFVKLIYNLGALEEHQLLSVYDTFFDSLPLTDGNQELPWTSTHYEIPVASWSTWLKRVISFQLAVEDQSIFDEERKKLFVPTYRSALAEHLAHAPSAAILEPQSRALYNRKGLVIMTEKKNVATEVAVPKKTKTKKKTVAKTKKTTAKPATVTKPVKPKPEKAQKVVTKKTPKLKLDGTERTRGKNITEEEMDKQFLVLTKKGEEKTCRSLHLYAQEALKKAGDKGLNRKQLLKALEKPSEELKSKTPPKKLAWIYFEGWRRDGLVKIVNR